jgi:SSS family solute:Na+ symporter
MLGETLLLALLAAPILYALVRARRMTTRAYLYNDRGTSTFATAASVVCGNVGIGTFVAIYLFTEASPLVGVSIVGAYTLGLVVCAAFAGVIHESARRTGANGLVDLIVATHGVKHPLLVWAPIAFVFVLRTTVQVIALALILENALGLPFPLAVAASVVLGGAYVSIGGYKVATETDVVQAVLILGGVAAIVAAIVTSGAPPMPRLDDLGPYGPVLLVGIWLFLPLSPILSVDNWQRIATARSAAAARAGYLLATPACLFVYAAIALMALAGGAGQDVPALLRALMPDGFGFVVDLMLVAAVLSTVDTVIVPLVASLARRGRTLGSIRLMVGGAFAGIGVVAAVIGDILLGVVAAFNALTVFLPAVVAALFLGRTTPLAAILSLNLGVASTVALTFVALEVAALAGFAVSTLTYAVVHRRARACEAPHPNR